MAIHHTEQMELACYGVIGAILATLPLLLSIKTFRSTHESTGLNGDPRPRNFFALLLSTLALLKLYSFHDLPISIWLTFLGMIILLLSTVIVGMRQTISSFKVTTLLTSLFFILSFVVNFSTEFLGPNNEFYLNADNIWHHWAAYLGAARSIYSGAVVLTDFPTQYGLGPTLSILSLSHLGWITGMFYAVGIFQMIMWGALVLISLTMVRRNFGDRPLLIFAGLAMMFGASYYWDSTSNFVSIHPSLGGPRFFPATLLSALIIFFDVSATNLKRVWLIHLAWAFAFLWSIESAFYVCLIWWPYYLFISLPAESSFKQKLQSAFKSGFKLLGIAALTVLVFLVVYTYIIGNPPSLSLYKAFVDYIRGPILINFHGRFLYSAFLFLFSASSLVQLYRKRGNCTEFRNLFVLQMLAYGSYSYYVGRSDDYNILPTVPFFTLILMQIAIAPLSRFFQLTACTLLLTSTAFMLATPLAAPYVPIKNYLHFNPSNLDPAFSAYFENLNTDRGKAIHFIADQYHESVVAFDSFHSLVLSDGTKDWTIYNNCTTYDQLPKSLQLMFIERAKNKFNRAGWLLFNEANGKEALELGLSLFSPFYNIDKTIPFGSITACRFTPKATP